MKQILSYTLLFILSTSHAQEYTNITSDWCKMGLKGKVKEMKFTTSQPKLFNKKKVSTYEHIIQFSEDGYITRQFELKKNGKHKRIEQRIYFSEKDKTKGYIIYKSRKQKDSILITKTSDTSFTELLYFYKKPEGEPWQYFSTKNPETFNFNRQQQLIERKKANKKYGDYRLIYEYNSNGHLTKETLAPPQEHKFIYYYKQYTTTTTDKMNNPTNITINWYNDDKKHSFWQKETIAYTYYD